MAKARPDIWNLDLTVGKDTNLPKPEWGTKRICSNCETRYYDMMKAEPECPICGTPYDPSARNRRARPVADARRTKEQPEPAAIDAGSEDLEIETELDEDIDDLDSGDDVVENVASIDENC